MVWVIVESDVGAGKTVRPGFRTLFIRVYSASSHLEWAQTNVPKVLQAVAVGEAVERFSRWALHCHLSSLQTARKRRQRELLTSQQARKHCPIAHTHTAAQSLQAIARSHDAQEPAGAREREDCRRAARESGRERSNVAHPSLVSVWPLAWCLILKSTWRKGKSSCASSASRARGAESSRILSYAIHTQRRERRAAQARAWKS